MIKPKIYEKLTPQERQDWANFYMWELKLPHMWSYVMALVFFVFLVIMFGMMSVLYSHGVQGFRTLEQDTISAYLDTFQLITNLAILLLLTDFGESIYKNIKGWHREKKWLKQIGVHDR